MTATTTILTFPATRDSLYELGRRWWLLLVSGIAWFVLAWVLLSFDVATVWTVAIFASLILLFGAFVEFVIAALTPSWRWMHLLLGVLFLAGGVCAVVWPDITFVALAALVSWMVMFSGVFDIVSAISFRQVDDLWWLTLLIGIAEVGVGLWAISYTGNSLVLLVAWLSVIAISRGIVDIVLAFQVRHLTREPI